MQSFVTSCISHQNALAPDVGSETGSYSKFTRLDRRRNGVESCVSLSDQVGVGQVVPCGSVEPTSAANL